MRLSTETNSLVNHMMSGTRGAPTPEIGMGATILCWTDRRPATIVGIEHFKTGKRIGQISAVLIQEDNIVRTDNNGMSEMQTYTFSPDPSGHVYKYKADKNGVFKGDCGQLRIGERHKYYDMSF